MISLSRKEGKMLTVSTNIDKTLLATIVRERFPVHPFAGEIDSNNFESLMRNYLAMSQAFPYIQAGAHKRLAFHYMDAGLDIPKEIEISAVVGAFLVWDETGGWKITQDEGVEGLLHLLDTRSLFHSNLLKKDLTRIFGKKLQPYYAPVTRTYLKDLHDGLASLDPVTRCAFMASFETHAERMIDSLWAFVVKRTNIDKEELQYFSTHVGGDDPAEAYHVGMTTNMIANLVPPEDEERFIREFINAYELHIEWCESITGTLQEVE
jgi:hypothetical protein